MSSPLVLSVTSPGGSGAGGSDGQAAAASLAPATTSPAAPKQLHPSETQLQAEAELGIPGDISGQLTGESRAAAGATSTGAVLAAPKPVVIETRAGPVSPKVSPRTLSRSPLSRSPAYSANSSPRGSSRSLASSLASLPQGSLNTSGVDDVAPLQSHLSVSPHPMSERRSSGGSNLGSMLHAATAGATSSPSATNGVAAGNATIASPMMVRRASKPAISFGNNQQLQAFLQRYTVADLQAWAAKRGSPSAAASVSPSPSPSPGASPPVSNPNPAHTQHPSHVIELPSTATPAEGFELLLSNNILSCPVYDAATKTYTGFLDVRDLVSSIIFAHEEQGLTTATFNDRWNELMLRGMQRFGTAVSVTYLSRRNPFRPMTANASLLAVARALSTQLHRVPIVDENGRCVSILSQSLMIQFLNAHKDELKDELRQTVGQLQLGLCKVLSVASDASAWTAFKTLEVNSVSGIAIVDRDGKLVGNTSARDLKFFVLNRGTLSLDAPIQVYLARIRQRDIDEARHPSCSIGLGTPIGHCLGLLSATGYHRVFIVDANAKPIGVVSITDILRFASADTSGAAGGSGSQAGTPSANTSQSPSAPSSGSSSPAVVSPPLAGAAAAVGASPRAVHLRSHSQSHTPVITPAPAPQ